MNKANPKAHPIDSELSRLILNSFLNKRINSKEIEDYIPENQNTHNHFDESEILDTLWNLAQLDYIIHDKDGDNEYMFLSPKGVDKCKWLNRQTMPDDLCDIILKELYENTLDGSTMPVKLRLNELSIQFYDTEYTRAIRYMQDNNLISEGGISVGGESEYRIEKVGIKIFESGHRVRDYLEIESRKKEQVLETNIYNGDVFTGDNAQKTTGDNSPIINEAGNPKEPWYKKWESYAVIGTFGVLVLGYILGWLQELYRLIFP